MTASWRTWVLDCMVVFLLASILIWPLYKVVYLDRWHSIESTFIADGRMLEDNLPHRHWQPLWYCGTRADYVYPPGLRYGAAILAKLLHTSPARAYHIYIALMYALGMVGVYVLVRVGNGSRGFAGLAAAATALLSPCFLFLAEYRNDSAFLAPQRLHALIDYGEGPHISALSVLPFVFAAALLGLRRRNPAWLAAAACAAALVVTHNFYGATALAILFPILAWACFLAEPHTRVLRYFAYIAILAYSLTAWWLLPSYLRVTTENLRLVAEPGNLPSVAVLAVAVVAFLAITFKLPARLKLSYGVFVWGGLLFLSLYLLGHIFFHFQVAGESSRLVPEFDLFCILAAAELLRWIWNLRQPKLARWLPRAIVVLVLAACCWPAAHYVRRAYKVFPEDHNWRDRIEYRTVKWVHDNLPGQRVLATGSIRFWYNVWFDTPQMDGGSQQGLLNKLVATSQWRIWAGNDMELNRLWLKALAVDTAIIPQKESKEIYHDLNEKLMPLWRKAFPILRDDGEGNLYYRIDRRVPGIVRIVDDRQMRGLAPIPSDNERPALEKYVNAIEAEPVTGGATHRISATRPNTDEMHMQATLAPGEDILVQETYDPAWRAYANGQAVPIEKDPVGFMLLHAPPGPQRVVLNFEPTTEIQGGRAVTFIGLSAALALLVAGYRRTRIATSPALESSSVR
jgi:hypothetical protein